MHKIEHTYTFVAIPHRQGIRHTIDRKCRRGELQGPSHDDTPDKVVDKDDLLMGRRF